MLQNLVAKTREYDLLSWPVLWVILVAVLTGVGFAVFSEMLFLVLFLIAGMILAIIAPVTRAMFLMSVMVLAAPYYQYRFDIPLLPFHFTLHRFLLFLAIPAVLLVVGHQKSLYKPTKGDDVLSEIGPALAWLFVWFLLEIVASIRSESGAGLARILPRAVGIASAFLIVLFARQQKQIRAIMTAYVLAAILPALVGLWQVGKFTVTGEFPGIPFQSFLENNLSIFEEAYKGAQLYNLPGIGIMPRFASVMVDPNFLSSYLSTAMLVAFGLFYFNDEKRKKMRKIGILGLLVVLLVVNLLTLSRSGLFALVVGFGVLIFVHPVARRMKGALLRIGLIAVVVYGLILLATSQTQGMFGAMLGTRLGVAGFQNGALDRLPYFRAGINVFFRNPIFGVGATNTLRFSQFFTTHSTPLTILAEFGMLGFAIFYGALLAFSYPVVRITHYHKSDNALPQLSATILAAMVSLLVATVPYDHLLTLEVNWILIGLFLAVSGLARKQISVRHT